LYPFSKENGFLDMRPPEGTFSDLTQYADEEFHHRPGPLRPLFLSARIKTDMMARMLRLSTKDRVVDVGCGNGRVVFFKRASCAQLVGIDAGEHFAAEAAATVDLTRGDIRRLPFATASFDKAYSLDVMEHLPEDGVRAMLAETRRILRPGGLFFAYSHVMMSSRLAGFQRAVNRLVAWLDRRGLVDNKPERDRKSDHVNALKSYEQLESLLAESGFRIERIRYYNVVMKAVIEDLFLPLVEHNLWRRRQKAKGPLSKNTSEADETSAERPNVGRWAHAPLALATALLRLDVALFGRVRTGPFFLLLRAL
jgi:SAM-dependent methyltransferase